MVALIEQPLVAMLRAHNIQPDTYDYKATWDSKLSASENFENLRSDLKSKGLWKKTEQEAVAEHKESVKQEKQIEAENYKITGCNNGKDMGKILNTERP